MKLYRLDATHDNGFKSRFFREETDALAAALPLTRRGWFCDVYEAELPPLTSEEIEYLVAADWPQEDNVTLLGYCRVPFSPLTSAVESLRFEAIPEATPPTAVEQAAQDLTRLMAARKTPGFRRVAVHGGTHARAAK